MKKILTIALLAFLPFFVTGCVLKDLPVIGKYFGNMPSISKETTINIWGMWESPEVMEAVIAKYKETNPNVTINYEDRSITKADQYKEVVSTRLSQEEGDVPDIVFVHNSWVPRLSSYLNPAPSSVISEDEYKSTFYPAAFTSAVSGGKIYAVPAYYDGLALVYNRKHFAEIDQETAPTAWEEFRRLALLLTQKDKDGNIIRAGAAIGGANNIDFFSDILGLLFVQAGVSVPSEIDSKEAQGALAFYTGFVNDDGVWNNSMPEASTSFAMERVSMIFVPSWNLLDIIRARPNLDIGIAPVPQVSDRTPASWASFWMYAVPKRSQNSDVAWNFIKFLSSEEAQLLMFSTASQYRPYGAPFSNVALKDQVETGPAAEYLKPYLDTAAYSKSSIFAARAGNANTISALKEAVNSAGGKLSYEEILAEVKGKLTGTSASSEK